MVVFVFLMFQKLAVGGMFSMRPNWMMPLESILIIRLLIKPLAV